MWTIPVVLATMLLVPAALIAACSAHDSTGEPPDRLRPGGRPDLQPPH